ncbi:hypothetical protein WM40_25180 [Robbsia andropogonis]|uniref:Lipoprotein n=2 Tax=Robbsia andropogonis TaxID=28092 RepID=A0A0F5JTG5_9BURK|nr:hypothetical protein [Robbsia andropogonis]KKB61098.1 hypothetical protein WM40_25180 [Robbsia andropogonis]MCP1120965.1 hypothetical protein [Robbsia andropogonis]MCP1130754.1 hypothetical protein [Robbsia andropogonis]
MPFLSHLRRFWSVAMCALCSTYVLISPEAGARPNDHPIDATTRPAPPASSAKQTGRIGPNGIAHPPPNKSSRGMVREPPVSPTESRMVHDPAPRTRDMLSGAPQTNGGAHQDQHRRPADTTDE